MHRYTITMFICLMISLSAAARGDGFNSGRNWQIDVGARWFKHSATGKPAEIGYNPVFDKWESIYRNSTEYSAESYMALKPLYWNFSFGTDIFARYRRYLLIKLGYDYSNPFGIGGLGHIEYVENSSGARVREEKTFSYTSHQIGLYLGPVIPVSDRAEVYIAIAPMAPTWVKYKESYSYTSSGTAQRNYSKTFKGFFGNCRILLGAQAKVANRWWLGSEINFTMLNYMKLSSGKLDDYSFQAASFFWNFTVRYTVFKREPEAGTNFRGAGN